MTWGWNDDEVAFLHPIKIRPNHANQLRDTITAVSISICGEIAGGKIVLGTI